MNVQLSAELFHLVNSPNVKAEDSPSHVHLYVTFDEYIDPRKNALWDLTSTAIHGLQAESAGIV